jgi:hypothetical protein
MDIARQSHLCDTTKHMHISHHHAYTLVLSSARDTAMSHVAKLFINGPSQAARLPAAYRFDAAILWLNRP